MTLLGCSDEGQIDRSGETPADTLAVAIRIGSASGREDALAPIIALAVSPQGDRIFLLENQTRLVRIFDRRGHFIGTAGGPGGGPGEFGNPMAIGFVGDTLWVADVQTYRFSLFDEDGRLLGDFRPTILARQPGGPAPPRPTSLLLDGTLIGQPSAMTDELLDGEVEKVPILRLDRTGSVLDTLAWRSIENALLRVRSPDPDRFGASYSSQPFAPQMPVLVSGFDSTVAQVSLDENGRAVLTATSYDGSLRFRTDIGWGGMPLDAKRVDEEVERLLDVFARSPSFPGVSRSTLRDWTMDALYVPEQLPPVGGMIRSVEGNFWLLKNDPAGESPSTWRVLDPDGQWLRDVVIPAGINLRAVHSSDAWGVGQDALDVPFVVRMDLPPSDG